MKSLIILSLLLTAQTAAADFLDCATAPVILELEGTQFEFPLNGEKLIAKKPFLNSSFDGNTEEVEMLRTPTGRS